MPTKPCEARDLEELLEYDPDTGRFVWKPRPARFFGGVRPKEHTAANWNAIHAGSEAFTAVSVRGYKFGAIFNKTVTAHRVAWAMAHGEWPSGEIDHINGDPLDNRLVNLRQVSRTQNGRNLKKSSANTSGRTGVTWDASRSKWQAMIRIDRKNVHLGRFATFEDACAARADAELKAGFHANHGR